jgi:hypothetical protein
MNQLTYRIAMIRHEERLREAAAYRPASHIAAMTKPSLIPPAARSRRSSRWTTRGLAATLGHGDRGPAIPGIRGQA